MERRTATVGLDYDNVLLEEAVMNVLSLFDGMSCGQIALDELGIPVDKYFAAEIDKYAIKVAKANYPDMVHLGDVRDVHTKHNALHAMNENGVGELYDIDLLIGGSPCQGFSFAGKQLNFDDPRSTLFFEYVRLLNALKPKYFLLENVKMKKESQDIITKFLRVEPIEINSNLVSAQNRKRLYWTNIPVDRLPEDKGIVLADILEDGFTDRDKSYCLDASYYKGGGASNVRLYFEKSRRQIVFGSGDNKLDVTGARIVNRRLDKDGKRKDNDKSIKPQARLELRKDNKAGCLTTVQKDSVVAKTQPKILQKSRGYNKGGLKALNGKTPTLSTSSWEHNNHLTLDEGTTWRKLSPVECERLQTVPDGYTDHVSNTQRYKMLGNGWTVDVIKHIMKGMIA
jgi:DNA-cytosine methyltransferase